MKRKLVLILALVLILSLTLAACGEHEHEFDGKWTYDASNHWHVATCDDTDETKDKAPHSFKVADDGKTEKCEVCGYSRDVVVTPKPDPDPKPEPKPHEHTYAAEFSADENGHFRVATCEHVDEVEDSAPHTYVDGICTECGWWSCATEVLLAELSKLDVWDYALTFNNIDLSNLSQKLDGIAVKSGELKLNVDGDGQFGGQGYFELSDGQSFKGVVSENTVYAIAYGADGNVSKHIRCTLDELLQKYDVNVDKITAYIDELNANTQQVRNYAEKSSVILQLLPEDKIQQFVGTLVKIDEEHSADDLTAYVVDYDALRNVCDKLTTATVAEYVDFLFGEGFFANLPEFVNSIFDMKVYEVFDKIEKEFGLSEDDVFQLIDLAFRYIYSDPDVNSLDEWASKQMGVEGVKVRPMVDAISWMPLRLALASLKFIKNGSLTANDIVNRVEDLCNEYGDKVVFQLIGDRNDAVNVEELKQKVYDVIDMLEENTVITLYVDSNRTMQKAVADFGAGSAELIRGYQLTQDYSKVIDDVDASFNVVD